ncbi:hypothetical protein [Sporomusa sphaeroides]|uniref:Uncharacterized protein n=1 Tax=Sporomusa sphaeroides DSM 2875 TaxID=1337886 RepID=A0ABP2C1W6_9FIRM|nr:hypothetical protein [Sporomusa sphaeroides]OLS56376.1 hypothetical protein SPSPH_27690 [Sporomusa sphaeroides DSM 2875]CVK18471.1 hypothetical protein SSPH_01109 [Sporomusa sphaeroides DSM 2875]
METLQEQLARVQAKIAAIETGAQEYGIGSKNVVHANLKTLYEREAALKQQISYESLGTTRAYARWPTR